MAYYMTLITIVILLIAILFLLIGFRLGKEHSVQQGTTGDTIKAFGSTWRVKVEKLPENAWLNEYINKEHSSKFFP